MSARILIFGGTGFLGKKVIQLLLQQGHHIVVCGRTKITHTSKHLTQIPYDCLDSHAFPRKKIGQVDFALYFAQPKNYTDFPEQAHNIFYINTVSLFELAEYCCKTGVQKLIYASSGGVFTPQTGLESLSESTLVLPRKETGFYLGTKLLSENLLLYFSDILPYTILRYFFIYGPNQRKEMLFSRLLKSVKENKPIFLKGENGFSFNPIYVEDAALMTVESIFKNTPRLLNIAGVEIVTLKNVVDKIGLILEHSPVYEHVNEQPENYIADTSLTISLLSSPQTCLQDGLTRFINNIS